MPYEEHRAAAGTRAVRCAVITCSDTRTAETDESGNLLRRMLESAGHIVPATMILRDEPAMIRGRIAALAEGGEVEAVICNGGTGISRRDNTFDAVRGLLARELPGFGELFRMLSYREIGSGAMLSRATAGVMAGREGTGVVVFSVPGSPHAVELAARELIIPELSHLVWELLR